MHTAARDAHGRRGGPSKFGRPSHVVALTLPEDVIRGLRPSPIGSRVWSRDQNLRAYAVRVLAREWFMNDRMMRLLLALAFMTAVSACSSSNPAQPSTTASVAVPRPLLPASNAQIRNLDQPVTLSAMNAIVTQSVAVTYTFEVATDVAFSAKVLTKDVAEGSGGQTSLKLDSLAPGKDYFWHARAQGGGTTGVFGATSKFTIGPAIVIGPPVLISPTGGVARTSSRSRRRTVSARSCSRRRSRRRRARRP
jgi:hypothetical protein